MKPLEINMFNGESKLKQDLNNPENGLFYSELMSFEGKLRSNLYSIKVPIQGVENYFIDNKKFSIKKGNYLVVNPSHNINGISKSRNETPIRGLCIYLTPQTISEVYSANQQNMNEILDFYQPVNKHPIFLEHIHSCNTNSFGVFLNSFKDHIQNATNTSLTESEHFFYNISQLLITQELKIRSKIEQIDNIKYSLREELFKRVDLMHQFIHNNYKKNISLDEIAKEGFLSKYHAIRLFKKVYNISPYQYLIKLRLKEAKHLLKKGESVSMVSEILSFSDRRSFSKSFKKEYQIAPSHILTLT